MNMGRALRELVWVRQQLPAGRANREAEQRDWHRAVLVNDTAVRTACQRHFVTPMDMRSDVPDGDGICRLCKSSGRW